MANSNLVPSEPVLFESTGGRIQGSMRLDFGRIQLTTRRLVFHRRTWLAMMGLVGWLLGKILGRRAERPTVEIELGTIYRLRRGKYGRNRLILDLALADGSNHRFLVDRFDDFTAALRARLAEIGRLLADGEERWQVIAA